MATADEILAEYGSNAAVLTVDLDTRVISIPKDLTNLGVESDDDVKRICFKMRKQYGLYDLSTFKIRVNYTNADNDDDYYIVTDMRVSDDDYMVFSWLVGRFACVSRGIVEFSLCLKLTDEQNVVIQEWNSTTTSLKVLPGKETSGAVYQQYPDVIENILDKLENVGSGDGTVKSVNNVSPDANGNVSLTVVKSVNGTAPDSNGNVTISAGSSGTASSVNWTNITDKPFGVSSGTTNVNFTNSGDTVTLQDYGNLLEETSFYRIGNAPDSIYDLTSANIVHNINSVAYDATLYQTIYPFNDILSDNVPEESYASRIIWDMSETYPNLYMFTLIGASVYIAMQDTIIEGVALAAGIWASRKTAKTTITNDDGTETTTTVTSGIVRISYIKYTKLDKKYLPECDRPTRDEVISVLPKTTSLDFTNWSDGSFVETLSDGTEVTHEVVFDNSGNVISIGGISISGVS